MPRIIIPEIKRVPLFSCCCFGEREFPADHLRTHGGELWCADCWDNYNSDAEIGIDFIDLPVFAPEATQEAGDEGAC